MDGEPFVKNQYAFRFLRLDRQQAERVKGEFSDHTVRPAPGNHDRFIVTAGVSVGTKLDWIERFVHEEGISEEHYDFFISTVTDTDTRIVSMPTNMVDLLRKIGGSVEFSFTVV